MRKFQIVLFVLGFAAFISSIFFIGTQDGDTAWRFGVAVLLLDLVCIKLWPTFPKASTL